MKHFRHGTLLRSAVHASAALLLCGADLMACECLRNRPVCQEAPTHDSVFFGKVVRISNWRQPAGRGWYEQKRVTFQVTETFIGERLKTVDVMTGMGGGDCGFEFKAGHEYLVYASRSESRLRTGRCSRTSTKERAAADLAYLRSLAGRGSPSLILGFVTAPLPRGSGVPVQLQQGAQQAAVPMAKVRVRLESKSVQKQMVTNALGNYWFEGLPPGPVTLFADIPKNLGGVQKRTFQLNERACSEQNFVTQ